MTKDFDEIHKAEITHTYNKAIKLELNVKNVKQCLKLKTTQIQEEIKSKQNIG